MKMGDAAFIKFVRGFVDCFRLEGIITMAVFSIFLQVHECKKENRTKVKVKKWIDTPDLKRNEKYILEWHDFVIELQEQLMKMTDESYSKKINLFVLQSFFCRAVRYAD